MSKHTKLHLSKKDAKTSKSLKSLSKLNARIQLARERIADDVLNMVLTSPNMAKLPKDLRGHLTAMEQEQRAAVGPKSLFNRWGAEMEAKVDAVMSDKPLTGEVHLDLLDLALQELGTLIPAGSVKPLPIESVLPSSDNSSGDSDVGYDTNTLDATTNSGLPYAKKRWIPTPDMPPSVYEETSKVFEYFVTRAKDFISRAYEGKELFPWLGLTAHRLVSKGPDWSHNPKRERLVIALDKAEAMVGKTLTVNALNLLRECTWRNCHPFVALKDLPFIDVEMQRLLNDAHSNGRIVLAGDLSNYDATIPPWLMIKVGKAVRHWFGKAAPVWDALVSNLVNNVVVMTPLRIVMPGPSSMKSGSSLTNLMDSLCNFVVNLYGEMAGWYRLDAFCMQGDDFVGHGDGYVPDAVSKVFKVFGMEAHPDKQSYAPDMLMFLQRMHYRGRLGGIASILRSLNSSMSYERLKTPADGKYNAYVEVVRVIAQIENNAFHPCFMDYVDKVRTIDKFQLGANLPPNELISRAGTLGLEELQVGGRDGQRYTHENAEGFEDNPVNRVLRGYQPPPQGDVDYFSFVYQQRAEPAIAQI
jgi:hypothetical protein